MERQSVDIGHKWHGTLCLPARSATGRASPPARTLVVAGSWAFQAPRARPRGGLAILREIYVERELNLVKN